MSKLENIYKKHKDKYVGMISATHEVNSHNPWTTEMLDTLFGIHSDALQLKARRMEVLSTNIANADTPGFKAKDIDFRTVLGWKLETAGLLTTHTSHRKGPGHSDNGEVFSIPYNTAVDGNTVEIGLEQAKFGRASVEYQATLDFLQGRVSSYKRALKGE
jgi:flagellar basal-body rod protein FlgB